jgi:hypothetical protein
VGPGFLICRIEQHYVLSVVSLWVVAEAKFQDVWKVPSEGDLHQQEVSWLHYGSVISKVFES